MKAFLDIIVATVVVKTIVQDNGVNFACQFLDIVDERFNRRKAPISRGRTLTTPILHPDSRSIMVFALLTVESFRSPMMIFAAPRRANLIAASMPMSEVLVIKIVLPARTL